MFNNQSYIHLPHHEYFPATVLSFPCQLFCLFIFILTYLLSPPLFLILASPSAILWDTMGRKGCLKYIQALRIFWMLAVILNAFCCALCLELISADWHQVCFSCSFTITAVLWFLYAKYSMYITHHFV